MPDKNIKDKENFIEECNNIMEQSTIYDRRLYKEEFKKLYNNKKYNFPLNNNLLSNIITKWKNTTNRFNKYSILENTKDKENRLILREYRCIPIEDPNKIHNNNIEYAIWGNMENINRMRKSKNFFIDGTFHHPPEFSQMLIIMYKDIITNLKIPGFYCLLNSKKELLYNYVLESIINILNPHKKFKLEIETIVTDQEQGLVNAVEANFPNAHRISCLFHYKQDLLRAIKSYGLYKKENKDVSNKIINILGKLPFIYKSDVSIIKKNCDDIIEKYPEYYNYITNYFLSSKMKYFEDNSLNYFDVPKDCRSNSFLENYNGYIKEKLGKKRQVNWVNFLNFIKDESKRSIEKLLNSSQQYENSILSNYYLKKDKDHNYYNDNNNIIKTGKINKNIEPNEMFKEGELKINFDDIINKEFGIKNLGNSCYINSTIQTLLHNEIFMKNFILKESKIKSKENSLSLLLWNIINSIGRIKVINNKINIDIRELVQSFKKKHPIYRGGIQNDAQEFCRVFLEDISLELNEIENIPEYYELPYQYETDKLKLSEIYYNNNMERENSIVTRIFYSQIISTYTCDCNNILYAFQNILDIPLLLPDKTEYINLYDSLKLYFNQEKIKMDAPCNKCKESNKVNTKVIKISKPPDILIFSIQRVLRYNNSKNNCYVNFPESLDLTDFIDEDLGKKYN